MFGFTVWLVIGGIVGWVANALKRTGTQQNILVYIVLGIIGSYAGGALLASFVGIGRPFNYLIALGGAMAAIAAYDFVKRARLR